MPDEATFAQDVRIVLASAEFSRELTSTVLWLSERGLDIRCVRLRPYTDGARTFVDVQQVLPLPEAADYFVSLREKREEERQSRRREREWSGLWFAAPRYHRNWQHCSRLGYLAAGGGPKHSDPLRKLKVGAEVVAYQKARGYVGYGEVVQEAAPVHELRQNIVCQLRDEQTVRFLRQTFDIPK